MQCKAKQFANLSHTQDVATTRIEMSFGPEVKSKESFESGQPMETAETEEPGPLTKNM